ncbi:hypothetical protein JCM10207_006930 [Rhodosporidiobolus poonsookiae]
MPGLARLVLTCLPLLACPGHAHLSPLATRQTTELDNWIKSETAVAVDKVFGNLGDAVGAKPGVVIASPSTEDPDYFFTWTCDAALTASGLLFLLQADPNSPSPLPPFFTNRTLSFMSDYIDAQAVLQRLPNPSGSFDDLQGLGEPKFNADLTAFKGEWGRPQRDGPALRALAVMKYLSSAQSRTVIEEDKIEKAVAIVRADLDYTATYWNHTTFDLWEEVLGSSFFTTLAQFHALRQGAEFFAQRDPQRAQRWAGEARKALCFAQEYLQHGEEGPWVRSNINIENGIKRGGLDANFLLATLLSPPPSSFALPCASHLFTPCSPSALSSLHAFLLSFAPLYPTPSPSRLTKRALLPLAPQLPFLPSPPTAATAIRPLPLGRYVEDIYFGGNPWYLTTLGAAEQLYRAVEGWEAQGFVEVGEDRGFWSAVMGEEVDKGRYEKGDETYGKMVGKVLDFAGGLLDVVRHFTPTNGQLDEQFDARTGEGKSAKDLTWSYIAFLTATHARSSALAAFSSSSTPPPADRLRKTAAGESWPDEPLDCPGRNGYNGTMAVQFEGEVQAQWGEQILLTGASPALGSWDLAHAVGLVADEYTAERPVWKTEEAVELEGRRGWEHKFVKLDSRGGVVWEGGENRILFTSSDGERTVKTKWKAG